MLVAALAGDLILLPALLAGPAGRFFKPRENRPVKPDHLGMDDTSTPVTSDDMNVRVPVSVETSPSIAPAASSAPAASDDEADDEAVPHLRLHFPRKDPPRQIKRSQ
jgi:hypothetical protein